MDVVITYDVNNDIVDERFISAWDERLEYRNNLGGALTLGEPRPHTKNMIAPDVNEAPDDAKRFIEINWRYSHKFIVLFKAWNKVVTIIHKK